MTSRAAASLLLITLTTPAPAQLVPARVRVSSGVMQTLLIKKVQPEYPADARRIEGTVVLKAIIDKDGNVANLQLISGHPMLAPAAIDAVKQWKYRPYLLNGSPMEVETQVQVNFTLADKPPAEGIAGDAPGGLVGRVIGSVETTITGVPNSAVGVPQRIRVSSGVAQGLLRSKVNPEYPPDAKDQHIQGIVLLQVWIDKEGNVSDVHLISGHPLLAPAAIDAVKQWKYKPYLLEGNPIEVETQVKVNFTLAP